jgi:hypothetical protein
VNPSPYELKVSRQSHSVVMAFYDNEEEIFSTDIVPAYACGANEFGDDVYMVPELLVHAHQARRQLVLRSHESGIPVGWLKSDPRGYITEARNLNADNSDFRKAVKIVKFWKNGCKLRDENFPLKSFDLELILTQFFKEVHADIFDAVFEFFRRLPQHIRTPGIIDRANPERFIDQYITEMTLGQRDRIKEACDYVLMHLGNIEENTNVVDIFSGGRYGRAGASEAFLFDQGIPIHSEAEFNIVGEALEEKGGFRARLLDAMGIIETSREIRFRISKNAPPADLYKWKVQNDSRSAEPRGEITDHKTRNDPERTKFKGEHYVECFAIKNGICIGRSMQKVILR